MDMDGAGPNWEKIAAIGQVAGAAATFLAVVVSLWIAFHGRRPRLRLIVGERVIIGGGHDDFDVLMYEVANAGERPVHVRGIGWRTGWLRWGPKALRRKAAVQITNSAGMGSEPPYEIQPGAAVGSYALMENVMVHSRERGADPFFTRDWPVIGRRITRVRAYGYTADGYTIAVKPEKGLLKALAAGEIDALVD